MSEGVFLEFYKGGLQSFYALWIVPALFLAWLLITPAGRSAAASTDPDQRFLRAYCVVFAIESILDPIVAGPVLRALGLEDAALGTAVIVLFVLLGDFRVFLLLFRLAAPGVELASAVRDAARWTVLVPLVALATRGLLEAAPAAVPSQTIWLLYEIAFFALAVWLHQRGIPSWVAERRRRARLRSVVAYVALYYGLWALADALILGFGLDAGWALRALPNQLYYSFYLPFVYFCLNRTLAAR
jgi:hypothetical protein